MANGKPKWAFVLMLVICIDHLAAPGYLKSWSNQTGVALARKQIDKLTPAPTPENVAKTCREATTDYDKILESLGVPCL